MKPILGNLCRMSFAAAGVMVATSAASAESRPGAFETEFDIDLAIPGGISGGAPTASDLTLDFASAAAKWEESIGAYLDTLLDHAPVPATAPAGELSSADDAAVIDAVIEADIAAFAAADLTAPQPETQPLTPGALQALGIDPADLPPEPTDVLTAVPANAAAKAEAPSNPLLLAPVLSHPMDCEQCHADLAPGRESATTEAKVDDDDAWQKMADWASARSAEDATPAVVDTDEDAVTVDSNFFFDQFDAATPAPTN